MVKSSRARGSRISARKRWRTRRAGWPPACEPDGEGCAADFDLVQLRDGGDDAVAVHLLELLGLFDGDVQAYGEVVGEVVAADGKHGGVGRWSPSKKTVSSVVLAPMSAMQTPSSRSSAERTASAAAMPSKTGVFHFEAGAVGAGDDGLRDAAGAGGEVEVHFELVADHADGVVDAGLIVEDELLREQVEDFAVGRKGDGAGAVDGGADLFAGDLASCGCPC